MATHIAIEKVWTTHKSELVSDGHPDAAQLIAPKGGAVESEFLRRYQGADKFFVEEGTDEADKARREDKTVAKPWTAERINAYRNYREDGNERTAKTPAAAPKVGAKPAEAEKVRNSRPGPDAAKVPEKAAAKKTA